MTSLMYQKYAHSLHKYVRMTKYTKCFKRAEHGTSPLPLVPADVPPVVDIGKAVSGKVIPVNLISKLMRSSTRESSVVCKSHKLMLENGIIQPSSSGIYHILPLGNRVLEKLSTIIDQEMKAIGGQKITMPCLTSGLLWRATDRWTTTGDELMKLFDRHGTAYSLGPTHEEAVTNMVAAQGVQSYKHLPLRLYQVGRKFRDEMKPKLGLLRAREFVMKDMYTFDCSEAKAHASYNEVCNSYAKLFDRLGLTYHKVEGSTGSIGGTMSHEYHVLSDVGEDKILLCRSCRTGVNKTVLGIPHSELRDQLCPQCQAVQVERNSIEIAHTFYLGTKYSNVFMASFKEATGRVKLLEMCCFGIGVTRLMAAVVEVLSTSEDNCITWPHLLAPFQALLIPPKDGSKEEPLGKEAIDRLYERLNLETALYNDTVIDDRRELTIGKRVIDGRRVGYPVLIIAGKSFTDDGAQKFEVEFTSTGEKSELTEDELVAKLGRQHAVPIHC